MPLLRQAATSPCSVAVVYGGGLRVGDDCTLGRVAFHGGGYPGYGYPGYGVIDPGYGHWNGAGSGVLRPGFNGGGTSFSNPHASQYFANPHASQGR